MNHGSLFTGIGGFDLAAEWVEWNNIFQVEIDEYCNKVLEKHWPNVKRYKDIREFDGTKYRGAIDIISGGVPCQPASIAGKRKGEKDDRWLWNEVIRIVREIWSTFILFENPPGILSLDNGKPFDRILTSLENEGYYNFEYWNGKKKIIPFIIPACGVGAWHRRNRLWIIAYCNNSRNRTSKNGINKNEKKENKKQNEQSFSRIGRQSQDASDTGSQGLQTTDGKGKKGRFKSSSECNIFNRRYWESEPELGRVAHGIPNRVDRLKGLGNAVIPQVVFEIFKIIDELYKLKL